MDNYDVVDFVFDTIEPVLTGFTGYKDKAQDKEKGKHYVVNALPWNENDDFINQGFVNCNIFIPEHENGMIERKTMKTAIRAVKTALKTINTLNGIYRYCEIIWTETVDLKEGFDCKNIKLFIKTDK